MSMKINKDGRVRTVSSSTPGKVLRDGTLRNIYIVKAKIGDKLYTLWELIVSTFFGKDGLPFFGKGENVPFQGKE